MYLLDTDTCIRFLRGTPSVMAEVRSKHQTEIHTSILTVYELELGLEKATVNVRKKRHAAEKMLDLFSIAPFKKAEAREAARIRAELETKGTPIGAIDYLIAGIARSHNLTLVTGNGREFKRVKNLSIENW